MKTYIFEIEIEQENEEGIWEAEIPILPGCAVWGHTREEALEALREGAKAYLEVKLEHGDTLPPGVEKNAVEAKSEVVAITV